MAMTKYKSTHSGVNVRFDQYLAELLIARHAQKQQATLPKRFWADPKYIKWTKEFKNQVRAVLGLVKIYDEEAILQAFLNNEWVYSARSPKFVESVQEEQRKLDIQNKLNKETKIVHQTNEVPKQFGKKRSRVSKLDD